MHASETWIRLSLISEPNPTQDVIDVLAGDGDFTVNYTARWQRAHRANSDIPSAHIPTLRDANAASTRHDVEEDSPFVALHDDDQDDW